MRFTKAITILLIVLILDQALKIYIKTNFSLYEELVIIPNWFRLHFIENNGMAFGMQIMDGSIGKLILSIFRLVAVSLGLVYLRILARSKARWGFIFCVVLIIAGAAGNLIDSMFYGMIFTPSSFHTVSHFVDFGEGYAPLFEGKVVDMLYFPFFEFDWPEWVPLIGGDHFRFFAPIFNIADFAISTGAISLLVFQNKFFGTKGE